MMKSQSKYPSIFLLVFLVFSSCKTEQKDPIQNTVVPEKPVPVKTNIEPEPMKEVDLAYIMGKFEPETHGDFIEVDLKYADRKGRILRKETYASFLKMYEAAKQDGVYLKIISATRNFANQKRIWESKWTGARLVEEGENLALTTPDPKERALKILKWSSMPGSSRHHWGSDLDLNNLENKYFESGEGLKVYNWLLANASTYGFCQPYTAKDHNRPNGYNEEKWHWSYLPISQPLTKLAKQHLENKMIQGFKGAETAIDIDVVQNFILGINQDCL